MTAWQRNEQLTLEKYGMTRKQRQEQLSLEKHGMTRKQRENQLTLEKHGMTTQQRRGQLYLEKHGITRHQLGIAPLSRGYVASKLRLPTKDLAPELLELKREQITIHRLSRQIKKELKNDHDG